MSQLTLIKRTQAEIKAAEAEMDMRLAEIPLALSNPYGRALQLEKELNALEITIKRLKAFVEFLRKLNPVQYLKWMQHAFTSYVPTKQVAPKTKAVATPEPIATTIVAEQPGMPAKTLPKPTALKA